jgi:hypothetical protein
MEGHISCSDPIISRPLVRDMFSLFCDMFEKSLISFLSLHSCRVALECGTNETYNILAANCP